MITKTLFKSNFLKEIKKIILSLGTVFIFLVFWANRTSFCPENIVLWAKNMLFLFKINKNISSDLLENNISKQNIKSVGNNFVILGNNSFSFLDKNGCTLRSQRHNLSNPCVKSSGPRAIIYDIGGKKINIETICGNILKKETKKDMISCSISESGIYGVLTNSQSYLSELKIYNEKNIKKFEYYFSEHYICDVELNSTGEECLCCGAFAENGDVSSCIYVLDFKQKTPKIKLQINDNLITKIKYLNNKNILAIGDNFASIINLNSKNIKNYLYNGKFLKFYDFKKDKGICYCLVPDLESNQNYEIHVINTLKKETDFSVNCQNIKNILYTGNRIFISHDSGISSYNVNGKLEKTIATNNIFEMLFGNSNSFLYAIDKNHVSKIKI